MFFGWELFVLCCTSFVTVAKVWFFFLLQFSQFWCNEHDLIWAPQSAYVNDLEGIIKKTQLDPFTSSGFYGIPS